MKYKNFEVEYIRRFLVSKLPFNINLSALPAVQYQLGYLSKIFDDLEIECECVNDTMYTLNIRDTGYVKRNVIKIPLDEDAASVIMSLSNPKLLNLTKHNLNLGGVDVSIVTFSNLLVPLIFIEVKNSESVVSAFKPEKWFSTEITGQSAYSYVSLATNKR